MTDDARVPVTLDRHDHVAGPFFYGTRLVREPGDWLTPAHGPSHPDEVSEHVYFSGRVTTAAWGAELETVLTGHPGPGHIYIVEPTGAFEDDPNVTTRVASNPTRSYRSPHPLRVVGEVLGWTGHTEEQIQAMLGRLTALASTPPSGTERGRGTASAKA